jgi:hypothetical protein
MTDMKSLIRNCGMCIVRLFGSDVRDAVDGELLGRALIVPWRGIVHLIGYEGIPLRMVCVPQDRIRYWRVALGFTKAEVPDYGRVAREL